MNQGTFSETDLLDALRKGEASAFETLVRTHGGRMLAVAKRLLSDESDANDALQDAFVSAFQALPRFAGDSALGTWLHRIVVNAALMKLRSRRRRPEVSVESLLPAFIEDGHHATPPTPWRAADEADRDAAERAALVRQKIAELPEQYRTVLVLRDIEELDTEATAQLLHSSVNAVKTRLHRARQALRTLLDPYMQER